MSSWQYKGLVSWLIVLAAKGAGRELGFALARRGKRGYPDIQSGNVCGDVLGIPVTSAVGVKAIEVQLSQPFGLQRNEYNTSPVPFGQGNVLSIACARKRCSVVSSLPD